MISSEKQAYYDSTKDRNIREDLQYAVSMVNDKTTAIDCGCGAGADIEYLSQQGFRVYGFDIEEEAISRCKNRFKHYENVTLSVDSFSSFQYPSVNLVVADASLFFCPATEFKQVWKSIYNCLNMGGVFCGSFLGPDDTMASGTYDGDAFWRDVLVLNEGEVRGLLNGFEILRFTEYKNSGLTPQGTPHDWHIFAVVGKKL